MGFQTRVLLLGNADETRTRIRGLLELYSRLRIVADTTTAAQALELCTKLEPDVIVADATLPGLERAIGAIGRTRATPIIVLAEKAPAPSAASGLLAAGARKVVVMPEHSVDEAAFVRHLFATIRGASPRPVARPATPRLAPSTPPPARLIETILSGGRPRPATRPPSTGPRVAIIGVSTGGPKALETVLPAIDAKWPLAIVIVQHMSEGVTSSLARQLAARSSLRIREAKSGDALEPGTALLAPGGKHLIFSPQGRVQIVGGPEINFAKPSIDVTMGSAAEIFGRRSIGVILTGMGRDGVQGVTLIKAAGGITIAQDERTSTVYGMPKAAAETGQIDQIVPIGEIALALRDALVLGSHKERAIGRRDRLPEAAPAPAGSRRTREPETAANLAKKRPVTG